MPSAEHCPSCGSRLSADAPEGLCSACLFKAVMEGMTDRPQVESSISVSPRPEQESPDSAIPPSNVRYFGDYEFREDLDEIARGGMGIVYRARQVSLDRSVALKMILPDKLDGEAVRRFRQEVESAANLDHPNIVPVFEFGRHEGQYFYSMKLIEGHNLADELQRFVDDPRASADLMVAIARAVHHAHQRGVLHRDLKPQNILVDREGQPHVTDFGLAKRMHGGREVTNTGDWAGTPEYMAPEQADGEFKNLTTAADIYSLGAIFYAMLTGGPPFRGPKSKIPWMVIQDEPARPRSINRRIDSDLETICLKCLEKDPNRRYPTAAAMADDLNRWLRSEPITARPAGRTERAVKWVRRKPAIAGLSAAVILVAVLGVAGIAWQWRQAVSSLERAGLNLYIAHMNLVQREWESANVERVIELLEEERPKSTGESDQRGFEWFYWHWLCRSAQLTLTGHADRVYDVTFSPDGKRMATIGGDATIGVWDATSGQRLLTLETPDSIEVQRLGKLGLGERMKSIDAGRVKFSPDGKRIASCDDGNTIMVWDAAVGRELLRLKVPVERKVNEVAFSPDGTRLASANSDGTVAVWDAVTGQEVRTFKAHGEVISVAFSHDGKRLASTGSDYTVGVWDAFTGNELLRLYAVPHFLKSVTFSPDGKWLASACIDKTVRLWDATTGAEARTLKGHTEFVENVAFSPDGERLASCGADRTIKVWRADDGAELFTLRGHKNKVVSVAFSPDGTRLASASWDCTVKVWDATTGQECRKLERQDHLTTLAFVGDGTELADLGTYWLAGTSVWDVATGRKVDKARAPITLSSDGKRLTLQRESRSVIVRDAVTGNKTATVDAGSIDSRWWVEFSSNSTRIAVIVDQTVNVWDLAAGKEIFSLPYGFECWALSPNGKWLGSASFEKIKIWDASTGRLVRTLEPSPSLYYIIVFSPDGKRIAACGDSTTVKEWEVATGRETLTLRGHGARVNSVAYSPDGSRLASASGDKTVKMWDAVTGQETLTLRHDDSVEQIVFSDDSKRLASVEASGQVSLWDATARPENANAAALGSRLRKSRPLRIPDE